MDFLAVKVNGSDVKPGICVIGLTSLPLTLTAKKSMKIKFANDKIYCNFYQKVSNIKKMKPQKLYRVVSMIWRTTARYAGCTNAWTHELNNTRVFKMAESNNTVTVSLYNWNCCQMNEIVYRVESIEWFTFHNHTESLIMQMIQTYCTALDYCLHSTVSCTFQTFRNTSFHVCILIIN